MRHVRSQFPDQGLNSCAVEWKCIVLTTELPQKSVSYFLITLVVVLFFYWIGCYNWSIQISRFIMAKSTNTLAQFSSIQSLSCVRLFVTPWIAARQASLSINNSRSSLRLTSIESVMLSSHLILGRPLLLPSVPPSIRVFSNESTLHTRWPKYWKFSFSISPSNEHPGLISFRMD